MKTYLELEGKLGPKLQPQSNQSRPTQPDTNPSVREETKATEKRKRLIPTKKYKMKVVARPNSRSSNVTVQPPQTAPNAPTNSEGQNPSLEGTSENNPPPLKNIAVHTGTPWPKAGKMSGNLFELGKDWPIPSTYDTTTATTSRPPIKVEPQAQEQPTPNTRAPQKQNDVDGDQFVPSVRT